MPKKLTYEYVKEQIEKKGYELLSKEYINNREKLKIKCKNGHNLEMSFDCIKRGVGCSVCSKKKKHSYEFIKEQIEKEGYELLSEKYINNSTKLKIKCPEGHEYKVKWNNFYNGSRCFICFHKNIGIKQKLKYEYVKEQIEKEGYKLLSKEYINNRDKLKIKCPNGHEYEATYGCFKSGRRCKICSYKRNSNIQKHPYEFIKEQIKKEGYELLSEKYKNSHEKIKIKCPEGHEYEVRYYDFQQGHRCPKCSISKQFSSQEKEIVYYLKSLNIDVIENDRNQIINPLTNRALEIDIFIPEYHKAIEFNGKYWHSFDGVKDRDDIKIKQCDENGIDLLIIDEKDWIDNRDECLNKINSFIGV